MTQYKQGDIIKVSFDPTHGHEQAGYRPALVVQNDDLTRVLRSVIVVLPITTSTARLPFQVPLDDRTQTSGVILCRQIRAVDLSARTTKYVEQVPYDILEECIENIRRIVEITPRENY